MNSQGRPETAPSSDPEPPPDSTLAEKDNQDGKNGELQATAPQEHIESNKDSQPSHQGFQFWAIMVALCITGLLGAIRS